MRDLSAEEKIYLDGPCAFPARTRKPRMSLDEHVQVAKHCFAIREHLFAILHIVSGKISGQLVDILFGRVDRYLLRFRAKIEDVFFAELPNEATVAIYFGATKTTCVTTCKKEDAQAAKLFGGPA